MPTCYLTPKMVDWLVNLIKEYKESPYTGANYEDALEDWDANNFDGIDEDEMHFLKNTYDILTDPYYTHVKDDI